MNRSKNLDILILAHDDFANGGFDFCRSLRMKGLNVEMYKTKKHAFRYGGEASLHPGLKKTFYRKNPRGIKSPEMRDLMNSAKVIMFHATWVVDSGINLNKKNIVVSHCGTLYRQRRRLCDAYFNQFVDVTLVLDADWINGPAKNIEYVVPAIDTNSFEPDYSRKNKNKILIGHFPSSAKNKGTDSIIRAVSKLKSEKKFRNRFQYIGIPKEWRTTPYKVKYKENMKRINSCDIYIEKCNLTQKGRKTGSWGKTALEASALGKIVVTQFLGREDYKKQYGSDVAIQVANGEEEIYQTIKRLLTKSDEEILEMKKKSREWVVKNHSLEATGDRLWNKVFKRFFPEGYKNIR